MTSIMCPFCGETMNAPIQFCTGCGRAVKKADVSRSSLRVRKGSPRGGESNPDTDFGVSRADHTAVRKVRNTSYMIAAVLAILLGYFCVMRFVLHEHLPGNIDMKLQSMISGSATPAADVPASQQTPSSP